MSPLHKLRNQKPENIGDHGRRSEEQVAKSIGARLTVNSGAGREKGDMCHNVKMDADPDQLKFRIEAKATTAQSIGLKKEWLDKIYHEATPFGEHPALTVSFVDKEGEPRDTNSQFVVIPMYLYKELFK
jgi:hypothetical protein